MRFLYIAIICIFASVNALATDLLPLDKDGFGGIKWGTEFSSADKLGMKECLDIGSAIICKKKDEHLQEIGGVPVKVKYAFNGAYLNYVYITFDDASLWPATIKALSKAYGESDGISHYYSKSLYEDKIAIYGMDFRDTQMLVIAFDIDTKDAAANRFDKMALSIFTGAERKNLDGFLGAKWGMTVDQLPQKVSLINSKENIKVYKQVGNLYFGSIPVERVAYGFEDGKLLYMLIYSTLKYSDIFQIPSGLFQDILELNFGKFTKDDVIYDSNQFGLSYDWQLPNTALKLQFTMSDGIIVIIATKKRTED